MITERPGWPQASPDLLWLCRGGHCPTQDHTPWPVVTKCLAIRTTVSWPVTPLLGHPLMSQRGVEGFPSPAQGEQVTFES